MQSLMARSAGTQPAQTPFVSVVCPTFNRREFLPYLLYIWHCQDYPADKRELLILDDSPHSNADLIEMMADADCPNVRYVHSPERLALGKKRNMLNGMAQGEYILCFDDDDYYPPDKISYQVAHMQRNNALFSGCDQIYVWYSHLDKIYLTHPFGENHALNGTFGLHRNLLRKNRYEDDASLGEEQAFLKGFTTPVLQVDPARAILCISHSSNTYDKDFIMGSSTPVDLTLEDFVKDPHLLAHYRRLNQAPLNTRVAWQAFDRIAVLYDPAEEDHLPAQCEALMRFGVDAQQLVPQAKVQHANPDIGELETHCAVLEQAQRKGWKNVLLLDTHIHFVKKEITVNRVNALLNALDQVDWQVLILGGRYGQLAHTRSLKGVARIRNAGCGCAYAVNGSYVPVLLDAYRQAIAHAASVDLTWPLLMEQHCWLGFSPGFAFLQQSRERGSGKLFDCTHWFFRKLP